MGERGEGKKEKRETGFAFLHLLSPLHLRVLMLANLLFTLPGKLVVPRGGGRGEKFAGKLVSWEGGGRKGGVLCRTRYCAVDQRRTSVVVTPPRKKRKQSLEQEGLVCWGRSEKSLSFFIPSFARRLIFKVLSCTPPPFSFSSAHHSTQEV